MVSDKTRVKLAKLLNVVPAWGSAIERKYIVFDLLNKKKKMILDIGCGWGDVSRFLSRFGKKAVAVDIIKEKIKTGDNFFHVLASAEQLPFKDGSFDQILCMDVIEHLKNDSIAASEMARVLIKNGEAIITTPSNFWKYPYWGFMRYFTTDEKTFIKQAAHVKKGYSLEELKSLFKGFEVKDCKFYINNGFSAFACDIEFSYLRVLENLMLKAMGLFLLLNFKLSSKGRGTHIGVNFVKK